MRHPSPSPLADSAALVANHIVVEPSGVNVLNDVSLTVAPRSRVGVIGTDGVDKSTFLQVLAGLLAPASGSRSLEPARTSVGYLAQEHERHPDESVRATLARRIGVTSADERLRQAASELALNTRDAIERYDNALPTSFESIGASTFDARAETVLAESAAAEAIDASTSSLSGGQEAKVDLAAIELSRFDIVLLDEPTNDLDFEGLARLEEWIQHRSGGLVVVSHDREFLERTVTSVLEIDAHSCSAAEYSGGWSGYVNERANALRLAKEAYQRFVDQRQQLRTRAERQRQWADAGVKKEKRNPNTMTPPSATFASTAPRSRWRRHARANALSSVSRTWRSRRRLGLQSSHRRSSSCAGHVVAQLNEVEVERGMFRRGPITLEIAWADRVSLMAQTARENRPCSTSCSAILRRPRARGLSDPA